MTRHRSYLHVVPADADLSRGLLHNSDGFVHLWPGDRLDLANEWRNEVDGARGYRHVIVTVSGDIPVEEDPLMGVAFVHRGDIPPEKITA